MPLTGKASDRSRWACASMAKPSYPIAIYSLGRGLPAPLRLYVCGLQPCPFALSFNRHERRVLNCNSTTFGGL
jgi:hypothetical protein